MNTVIHQLKKNNLNNKLYIKREDLYPFSFGGNKARKADLFFKEIKNKNIDSVVTYGSSSSNHCRVVANKCASLNIECYIITPEKFESTHNSNLVKMSKAQVIETDIENVEQTINETLHTLQSTNKNVYFIPGGGHGNLGTHAYVNCFDEIVEYEEKQNIKFDYVFLASGTGTTQAGLVCGTILKDRTDLKVIGISIAREQKRGSSIIKKSIEDYLGKKYNEPIYFFDNYTCGGYGQTNRKIEEKIQEMYLVEGIALDPIYTAKAYYGMEEYLKSNKITEKNILFIHTGGTPIFFDYMEELL